MAELAVGRGEQGAPDPLVAPAVVAAHIQASSSTGWTRLPPATAQWASEAATRAVTFDRDERALGGAFDRGVQDGLVHVGEPALEHRIVQAAGRGRHLPRARPRDRDPGLSRCGRTTRSWKRGCARRCCFTWTS